MRWGCDSVYPVIPQGLQHFQRDFPKMKMTLLSSFARVLSSGVTNVL